MKAVIKALIPQGFEVSVYAPKTVQKDGFTSCRKVFIEKGYAISVVGYNRGGYAINKYAIREVGGEVKILSQAPLALVHFDTYKELQLHIFDILEKWAK